MRSMRKLVKPIALLSIIILIVTLFVGVFNASRASAITATTSFSSPVIMVLSSVTTQPTLPDVSDLYTLVETSRKDMGSTALIRNKNLEKVAAQWAVHMAASRKLEHNSNLTEQVPSPWIFVGENVGYGPDARKIHMAWMLSPGHRTNILDTDYTDVGVAGYTDDNGRMWAVQVFAAYPHTTKPVNPTATPTLSEVGDYPSHAVVVDEPMMGTKSSDKTDDYLVANEKVDPFDSSSAPEGAERVANTDSNGNENPFSDALFISVIAVGVLIVIMSALEHPLKKRLRLFRLKFDKRL